MAQATGAKAQVKIGIEQSFKQTPTTGFLTPVNSCNIKSSRNKNTASTLTGDLNPQEPFDGNVSVSGSIVIPVDSTAFWYYMQLSFGDPITTGAGPFEHVFKLGNDRPSFTVEEYFPEVDGTKKYIRYSGCKIGSMSMSVGGDGELTASFNITGANRSIETSSFDSSAALINITRFQNSDAKLFENSTEIAFGSSVELSVDFGLDTGNYCIGDGGTLGSIPDGIANVSGSIAAMFKDTTLIEKALNSTESSVETVLTDKNGDTLEFKVPQVQYSEDFPSIDGPQGIQITLPYVGYYSTASESTAFQVTLTNSDEHA